MKNKTIIYLDTNVFTIKDYNIKDLNLNGKAIHDFVDENLVDEVILAIPEVVIHELIAQQKHEFEKYRNQLIKSYKKIKQPRMSISLKKYKELDIADQIEKQIKELFKKYKRFVVIPSKEIVSKEIIERAKFDTKPFKPGNSNDTGSGFKDTVIWLDILDYSIANKDNDFIFITSNTKDFHNEEIKNEFKLKTGKDIVLYRDIDESKEELDKKFNLELKLEEKHDDIKEKIKKHIGDFMIEIHKEEKLKYLSLNKRMLKFEFKDIFFNQINENEKNLSVTLFGDVVFDKEDEITAVNYYEKTFHQIEPSIWRGMGYDTGFSRFPLQRMNKNSNVQIDINFDFDGDFVFIREMELRKDGIYL